MPRSCSRVPLVLIPFVCAPAAAVELREYDPQRHDRFLGSATEPSPNPDFLFDAGAFHGLGWQRNVPNRQFALITRKHVVFASHYLPGVGATLDFLAPDGALVSRQVAARVAVANDDGSDSDLAVIELNAVIPAASGIEPFPYLDLANDFLYRGRELAVFGFPLRAGRGEIERILTLSSGNLAGTRALQFDYRNEAGDGDDCFLQVGDSGSPSFAFANGRPALVGTHSSIDVEEDGQANFDAFVPHYVAGVDTLVAADGFRITPALAGATTGSAELTVLGSPPRRANPLGIEVTYSNEGVRETGNLEVTLAFAAGERPDTVSGEGWIASAEGDSWTLRRARVAGFADRAFTAEWEAAPDRDSLALSVAWSSDKTQPGSLAVAVELGPSFASWLPELPAGVPAGPEDDADGDGLANLVEYGLGGDPLDGLGVVAGGGAAALRFEVDGDGTHRLRHPERTDRVERGLSYPLQFSNDLADWSLPAPPGLVTSTRPYDPPVDGLVERVLEWSGGDARIFVRLGVELDE